MSIISKLFSGGVEKVVNGVGGVLDNVITNDEEKLKAKNELTKIIVDGMTEVYQVQGEVLKTEMQGSWLQKNWRPITMLAFVVLLFARWLGYTESVSSELELELMSLIQIGLGGYVAGRSIEKVSDTVTKNIDMSFLKKKERN